MSTVQVLYRAMEEEFGMPKLGATAKRLGIRLGHDISKDAQGLVHRPGFQPRQANGLSCAPDIQSLPAFAMPVAWGGRGQKTVVWAIDTADLGPDLIAQEDTPPGQPRHASIGPSRTMPLAEFCRAIEATQDKWVKMQKS